MKRCNHEECTQRDIKAVGDPNSSDVDPQLIKNFRHLLKTFLEACQVVTAYNHFDVEFNTKVPKCLLETCFPHIFCKLIDAINEMEDVETQADNFIEECDLVVEEIREYLKVLKPLRPRVEGL